MSVMKVGELIEKLQQFPASAIVLITDGHDGRFYRGQYSVEMFEDCVDIGIGGCEEYEC